jgi:hypothetical protein
MRKSDNFSIFHCTCIIAMQFILKPFVFLIILMGRLSKPSKIKLGQGMPKIEKSRLDY